jgi:hypothetical protein
MNKATIITTLLISFFVYIFSCGQKDKMLRQNTKKTALQPIETETTLTSGTTMDTHSGNSVVTISQGTNNPSPTTAISEFLQRLQDLGRSNQEIIELTKIERESYGIVLREIMFNGGHFYYEGFDVGQTPGNCGIYAVRRKLKHMYDLNMLTDETAWYRLSDKQMRDLIATGPNVDPAINRDYVYRGEHLDCEDIVNLQIYMGIPIENCSVLKTNGFRFIHSSQTLNLLNPSSLIPHRDNIIAIDQNTPS